MKVGYTRAAWRLFQVDVGAAGASAGALVTWADTELEGTPFQSIRLPLPVVRPKSMH